MIYKISDCHQMLLENPTRRALKNCLIMGKYLNVFDDENNQVLIDIHTVAGYCDFSGHLGLLTINEYKRHHCADKKCPMFHPYRAFPYWKKHKDELLMFYGDRKND